MFELRHYQGLRLRNIGEMLAPAKRPPRIACFAPRKKCVRCWEISYDLRFGFESDSALLLRRTDAGRGRPSGDAPGRLFGLRARTGTTAQVRGRARPAHGFGFAILLDDCRADLMAAVAGGRAASSRRKRVLGLCSWKLWPRLSRAWDACGSRWARRRWWRWASWLRGSCRQLCLSRLRLTARPRDRLLR